MWQRNASRFITGPDMPWRTVVLIWAVIVIALLLSSELMAYTIKGFAAKYSHPSAVIMSLVEDFHLIFPRFLETARRGAVGIVIAGLIAYPLGVLLFCVGRLARIAFIGMVVLLVIPKLAVTLFSQLVFGYGETSLYVMALWIASVLMLVTGFLSSLLLQTTQRIEKEADLIFKASALDRTPLWKHYLMVMQMLRAHHVASLQVLSMTVWTSLTFSEALSTSIIGLGERMQTALQHERLRDELWASMLMLIVLEILSFTLIASLSYALNTPTTLLPSRNAKDRPPAD